MRVFIALMMLCGVRIALGADAQKPATPRTMLTRWAKDVSPTLPHPEYPRPQMARKEWLNLNGPWSFTGLDDIGSLAKPGEAERKILVPFCMESHLSGIAKHYDHSIYSRTFTVPTEWDRRRHVLLHFGAVDYECSVDVNGKKVGSHVGGYDAFSFDITDALKPAGEQTVTVTVTDVTAESQARGKQTTKPEGIWYTPCSGIWQTVWIEPVNAEMSIHGLKITPNLDDGSVSVKVEGAGDWSAVFADVTVLDGDKVVGKGSSATVVPVKIAIDKPRVWSPDDPFLYKLQISIRKRDVLDTVESYFGMRKIEVSPDEKGIPRIKLNGKAIMQIGPLDQGFWPDGIYTAPTDEAMRSDLVLTKKLGFNMIRKHVKVEPQTWYRACDEMGILVWQDMPSPLAKTPGKWQEQFQVELKALVEQHINAPCIITWVLFNEGWGQDAYGKDGTQRIAMLVKSLDPTRLVNNASGWTDAQAGDMHDIHVYPGPAAPPIEKARAIVLGEFGGLGLGVDGHMWTDKHWGYQGMASQQELTDRYVRLLGRLWELNESAGLCAGVYTQTSDVETESNGFLTYDREVLKVDADRVREANLGKGPRVTITPLIKTARDEPADWKYTIDKPADGWIKGDFDDASWKTGPSGFGTEGTPGATVRTKWDTADIWLRREVELSEDVIKDVDLLWHHDDACQVYINGVLAARSGQFTTDYTEQRIKDEARTALKPGKNLVAVHCHQTVGGQYIDLGFIRLIEKKGKGG